VRQEENTGREQKNAANHSDHQREPALEMRGPHLGAEVGHRQPPTDQEAETHRQQPEQESRVQQGHASLAHSRPERALHQNR
jgi:hypothetical protein